MKVEKRERSGGRSRECRILDIEIQVCGNTSEGRLAGEVGEERNMKGGWREGKVLPWRGQHDKGLKESSSLLVL